MHEATLEASAAAASSSVPDIADAAAPKSHTSYPIGAVCSDAEEVAREKQKAPSLDQWLPVASKKQHLHLRVPPGVFQPKEGADRFRLVSALKAAGLADAPDHVFEIRFRRIARGIDALLADRSKFSPLARLDVELVFPNRTSKDFKPNLEDPVVYAGFADRTTVAGRPAYVWVTGVEGYNTDAVLVDLGKDDTLLITADWSSSIMGQPECYQRTVIGGVIDSVVIDG